ncbi:MAG: hypothetical protein IJB02_05125 [Oscillospiraceae bacterium]|nr:hypothetical protein [Oscillospiraceae bacterium]
MKRILSWILLLTLLAGIIPAGAAQAYAEEAVPVTVVRATTAEDPGLPENDALFEGYLYRLFYDVPATYRRKAGDLLEGDEKVIYDALVPIIKQIAAGERASTIIGIGEERPYLGDDYAVDVQATFTGTGLTNESLTRLVNALLTDLPYDMYWYDKVRGCACESVNESVMVNFQIAFVVAENYMDEDIFSVKTAVARSAATAAKKSSAIVAKYADASDYEKLLGYKNEICNLVTYDYDAAEGGYFSADNDPWQLIHVFDGNTATNVVCEGYSKAFMYLCEQTAFDGDISCITVSGVMGGPHMWNVVSVSDRNYLVDVTNSESNTVGYDGRLFLAGGTGSVLDGYTVGGYRYTYGDETINTWGVGADSVLTLAAEKFVPHTHSYVLKVTLPTCTEQGYTTHTCNCGDTFIDTYVDALGHDMQGQSCTVCGCKAVELAITGVTLRSGSAGLYYEAGFQVTEGVKVRKSGIALSVHSKLPVADDTDPLSFWTEGRTSVAVTDILKEDQLATSNEKRATTPIYARAYAQLEDGTYIYSDVVAMYLRQVVEAANAQWSTLDPAQKTAIAAMYTKFKTVMEAWDLTAIESFGL